MNAMSISATPAAAGQGAQTAQPALPGGRESDPRLEARRQAVEFEAVYLSEMLKPMFENVTGSAAFEDGTGQDVWRSMQVQEFGKAIARQGGIGIADAVTAELLRAQESSKELRP